MVVYLVEGTRSGPSSSTVDEQWKWGRVVEGWGWTGKGPTEVEKDRGRVKEGVVVHKRVELLFRRT